MATSMVCLVALCLVSPLLLAGAVVGNPGYGGLFPQFYDHSCPKAKEMVHSIVAQAVARETRMAASLVRLHFHDCFVNVPQVSSALTMNVMLLSIYCCVAVTEKKCCDVSRAVMVQSCWMVLMARNLHYPT